MSTQYAKLYPQNGDRLVTIDSVTSFHPYVYAKINNGYMEIRRCGSIVAKN